MKPFLVANMLSDSLYLPIAKLNLACSSMIVTNGMSTASVYLRPSEVLTIWHASYYCLQSINTCIVTSCRRLHIQNMAVWLHGYSFELNTSSKIKAIQGLLQPIFRRSNNMNMNVVMDVDNLLEG